MNETVLDLYREGLTVKEIVEETGLAHSSVAQYIYKSRINKDPEACATQLRVKIRKMIAKYEAEFGEKFTHSPLKENDPRS